jgi:nicotinamidase-related amidase
VKVIHAPIALEKGHNEISESPYGILKGVKDGEAFLNGTWGAEICDAMKPNDGDLIVKGKSGLRGFESTNLDFLLRQNGIKNVILGGFLTNCCVESTMRSANEKGYHVCTLKDCVAATSMAAQEATLEHNSGMFSIPTTSSAIKEAIIVEQTTNMVYEIFFNSLYEELFNHRRRERKGVKNEQFYVFKAQFLSC